MTKAVREFSKWFYTEKPFLNLVWMGVPIVKCPFDLHMYQQVLWHTKPDLIVETGTFAGGSALYLAHLFDIIGAGQVISIDIRADGDLPSHDRIEYLRGVSSTDLATLDHVREAAAGKRTMVILDSAHNKRHVLKELQLYHKLVSKGCYLIVEDSNHDGYYLGFDDITGPDDGPAEALKAWQPSNNGFTVDKSCESLGLTFNPSGYLVRTR